MKSLEEYLFLESIKVVNGSAFKEKASMDLSAWNDWKEAVAKEHEDYIVYEENIKDIEQDVKKLIKCNNLKYDMNYEKFKKIENILKENEENNV